MAVRIRLARRGGRNENRYRVVVADQASRRDGRLIEILGIYHPGETSPDKKMALHMERAKYWLSVGAQPSELVRKYLGILGLLPAVDFSTRQKKLPKAEAKAQDEHVSTSPKASPKKEGTQKEAEMAPPPKEATKEST